MTPVRGFDVAFSPVDVLRALPYPATAAWPEGVWDREVWRDAHVSLSIFAPKQHDHQGVHERDELYVVVQGCGTFVCGATRHDFEAGDVLLAPAGEPHHFECAAGNLIAWVIFWGDLEGRRNREVIRALADAWQRQDVEEAMRHIAPDCIYSVTTGPGPGRDYRGTDEVREAFAAAMSPDDGTTLVLDEPVVARDRVFLEWRVVGSAGELSARGVDLFTLVDGLVVRKDAFRKVFG